MREIYVAFASEEVREAFELLAHEGSVGGGVGKTGISALRTQFLL